MSIMTKRWPLYQTFSNGIVKVHIRLPNGNWYWIANYIADSTEQKESVFKDIDESINRVMLFRKLPFFSPN
jgi:hypothetical protein